MSLSSRHAIATHILLILGCCNDGKACSEAIASSVNTNSVVIRRLLAKLKEAGLVKVQKGADGGYSLAKSPSEITLWEVFVAVEDLPLFSVHKSPPNPDCVVGCCVQGLLKDVYSKAEEELRISLQKVTLCSLVDCVEE